MTKTSTVNFLAKFYEKKIVQTYLIISILIQNWPVLLPLSDVNTTKIWIDLITKSDDKYRPKLVLYVVNSENDERMQWCSIDWLWNMNLFLNFLSADIWLDGDDSLSHSISMLTVNSEYLSRFMRLTPTERR